MNDIKPSRAPMLGLLGGVLTTQFVNSALHLVQPLVLAKISGSFALAAFFSSFDTGVHMFGTFCGGWPTDRFGARKVLVASTFLRGVSLAAIPVAQTGGFLTVEWAMVWYTADAFVRGFVDASVHTVPLELAEHHGTELDRINSSYEFLFDLGGIVGPLALTGLMLSGSEMAPNIIIPAGFIISALVYALIPRRPVSALANKKSGGTIEGLKVVFSNRALFYASLGLVLFNIYPLRKLLAAFFASSIANVPAYAGTVGAAFAGGGIVGVALYARFKSQIRAKHWIQIGAGGVLLLSAGWIPGNAAIMAGAAFLFAITNSAVRLCLTRIRQMHTPLDFQGGVTSASQFGANLASVVLKAVIGGAFAIGASAYAAFTIVGVALAALAVAQLALAKKIT